MLRVLSVIGLSLFLAGCNEEDIKLIRNNYVAVNIPPALYAMCPEVGRLPSYKTLTDLEVANLIVKLYNNNTKCRIAMDSIKSYVDASKKTISKR